MGRTRVFKTCALTALLAMGPIGATHAEGFYFGAFGGLSSGELPQSQSDTSKSLAAVLLAPGGFTTTQTTSSLDDSDTAWGLQIGYEFNHYVAAEVGFVNLGKVQYAGSFTGTFSGSTTPETVRFTDRVESKGPTLAVVGMFPFANQHFDIHGRAGILFSRTDRAIKDLDNALDPNITTYSTHASGSDPFLGAGMNWNINASYAVRVEYTHFMNVGDGSTTGEGDFDIITAGVLFH